MADVMEVELYGGPADGMKVAMPAHAKMWVSTQPQMTPAEFIALETGGRTPESALPAVDHIYVWTKDFSRTNLLRYFRYSGPRYRKEPS